MMGSPGGLNSVKSILWIPPDILPLSIWKITFTDAVTVLPFTLAGFHKKPFRYLIKSAVRRGLFISVWLSTQPKPVESTKTWKVNDPLKFPNEYLRTIFSHILSRIT